MPKGLKRRYGQKHLHFITCSCYRRLPLFASVRAKNLFVKILGDVRCPCDIWISYLFVLVRGASIPKSQT
jgi:hypothetical protein